MINLHKSYKYLFTAAWADERQTFSHSISLALKNLETILYKLGFPHKEDPGRRARSCSCNFVGPSRSPAEVAGGENGRWLLCGSTWFPRCAVCPPASCARGGETGERLCWGSTSGQRDSSSSGRQQAGRCTARAVGPAVLSRKQPVGREAVPETRRTNTNLEDSETGHREGRTE